MPPAARAALGSLLGAALAACIAPFLKPLFSVPTGGVGFVTVHGYAKSWDYAVVALLVIGAFAGGACFVFRVPLPVLHRPGETARVTKHGTRITITLLTFVLMLFIHDHPYQHMDPFHEGEHLTPGFLLQEGARPYGGYFVLHGFAA